MKPEWVEIIQLKMAQQVEPSHSKVSITWRADVYHISENEWLWEIDTDKGHPLGHLTSCTSKPYPTADEAMQACDQFIEELTK